MSEAMIVCINHDPDAARAEHRRHDEADPKRVVTWFLRLFCGSYELQGNFSSRNRKSDIGLGPIGLVLS